MENLIAVMSDYGLKDAYVGTLKATLYMNNPEARVVDITHHIRPFDLVDAAIKLKWSYRYFPSGTVFLIAVDPDPSAELIIISTEKYYIVTPNNGIPSLMLEEEPADSVYIITADHYFIEGKGNFRGRNQLAPIAAQLAKFQSPFYLGDQKKLSIIKRFRIPSPKEIEPGKFECIIIDVDSFGNLILNMEYNGQLPSRIEINGVEITSSSLNFRGKKKGEFFISVNPEGHYQLISYMASAARLLKATRGTKVVVEF
ncbi:SAM-dependent chlorinase/fluorinase [Desulfurobacterium sp.]|uniref:SAM hydrolase/SAM-dependent halogenase family protein n=1 Tax=Desulfurobacterium sp. TaxID=2004706 RepID=UPI00263414A8|nr:SAM-dependent chlorinase/fluorinase [Desulfurobacterium sp.]